MVPPRELVDLLLARSEYVGRGGTLVLLDEFRRPFGDVHVFRLAHVRIRYAEMGGHVRDERANLADRDRLPNRVRRVHDKNERRLVSSTVVEYLYGFRYLRGLLFHIHQFLLQ